MLNNNSTCSHCGKPLTIQACIACEGTGFSLELAFVKRNCPVCHGSGRVWRCEDEYKHIVDDFKAAHAGSSGTPAARRKHKHADERREQRGWNPDAWYSPHPENPFSPNASSILVKGGRKNIEHHNKRLIRKPNHKK